MPIASEWHYSIQHCYGLWAHCARLRYARNGSRSVSKGESSAGLPTTMAGQHRHDTENAEVYHPCVDSHSSGSQFVQIQGGGNDLHIYRGAKVLKILSCP